MPGPHRTRTRIQLWWRGRTGKSWNGPVEHCASHQPPDHVTDHDPSDTTYGFPQSCQASILKRSPNGENQCSAGGLDNRGLRCPLVLKDHSPLFCGLSSNCAQTVLHPTRIPKLVRGAQSRLAADLGIGQVDVPKPPESPGSLVPAQHLPEQPGPT